MPQPPSTTTDDRRGVGLAAGAIVAAAALAYAGSFAGPFVFDDGTSIPQNPTIRHLWPPWAPFLTPRGGGLTVSGRPLLNWSFAVNYAIGGNTVFGYHAVNWIIHVLAALTLFGIVRWAIARAGTAGAPPTALAAAIAALWAVHPLTTEAVTYIVQRAESLASLFYLLTLYAFIRACEGEGRALAASNPWPRPGPEARPAPSRTAAAAGWRAVSLIACMCGMATKEIVVSAPVLVLLFDRAFFAGSIRAAMRARGAYYACLAGAWVVLAILVFAGGGNRGGSIGFGVGVGWWPHLLTQFPAILHYVRLVFWPHPLILEYTPEWIASVGQVLPGAVFVLVLLGATLYALARNHPLGIAGALFFCVLAPTSLMPAPSEFIAEYRMYLPLAAVLAVAAILLNAWIGRRSLPVLAAATVLAIGLTFARNKDYRSAAVLWADTAAKQPDNALAHELYGEALDAAGDARDGLIHHQRAVDLRPDMAVAQAELGYDLANAGDYAAAQRHFEAALRLKPESVDANNGLGGVLAKTGHLRAAIACFEEALRVMPDYQAARQNLARAHFSLGNRYVAAREWAEAAAEYEQTLKLDPRWADAEVNLGAALLEQGRKAEALAHFKRALQLDPNATDIRALVSRLTAPPR